MTSRGFAIRRAETQGPRDDLPNDDPGVGDVPKQGTLGTQLASAASISYVGFAVAFVSSVLVARVLGPEGKGAFSMFMATAAGLMNVAVLGIPHGQMYHVARRPQWSRHFMPNGYLFAVALGGTTALAFLGAGHALGFRAIADIRGALVAAMAVLVPVGISLTYQRQFFLLHNKYALSKFNFALTQALPFAGYLTLWALGMVDVVHFVAVYVGMNLLVLLAFRAAERRLEPVRGQPSWGLAHVAFTFGYRQFLSDLALYLTLRLDYFLVFHYLGQAGLGIYAVAMGLAEVITRFSNEIGVMLFPAFATGKMAAHRKQAILRLMVFLASCLALGLFVLATPIVTVLFGDAFVEAIPAFRWLLLGTVAWSTIHITWTYTAAEGFPQLGVPIFGGAAAIDLGLNVLLLPRLGITGAAVAATISYVVAATAFLTFFCLRERCGLRSALVMTEADFAEGRRVLIEFTARLRAKSA